MYIYTCIIDIKKPRVPRILVPETLIGMKMRPARPQAEPEPNPSTVSELLNGVGSKSWKLRRAVPRSPSRPYLRFHMAVSKN